VTEDVPSPDGQRVGNGGVAAGEIEVFLEVGGFDMDGGVEMTLTHAYIDV